MALSSYRTIVPAALILFAGSACGAHAVPSSGDAVGPAVQAPSASYPRAADAKSILKTLTKDVTIGSAVDTGNGDKGPRALSIAHSSPNGALTKGQLVFCNFEDSAGNAGAGTTIEALNPKPRSKPERFIQSDLLKGCVGNTEHPHNGSVYGAGLTSGKVVVIAKKGKPVKTYSGKTFTAPFWDLLADPSQSFSPLYVYVGTTKGTIVSIAVGFYGNGQATEVAKGFAASKGSQGWLAPSGFQYDRAADTLYIVDGITNTIVAFTNASKLLDKDEILVEPGGKTFKCKYPKTACAHIVYSGSPLNAPMASALLPNGNLIVANTQGTANTLVELTPTGQVLDTKVVDQSSTQGVFGLAAGGTNDSNTVLFFTDTNSNTVQELER
ncbi:MAG: hypothetical protein WAK84_09360 [Candidatus Cybelea sp.]